jgi:homoserine kinase
MDWAAGAARCLFGRRVVTKPVGVSVPASTSNLGPGFDALSLALGIYLRVAVEPSTSGEPLRVAAVGVDSHKMPAGRENLIVQVMDKVAQRRRRSMAPVLLRVENEIPLARGLGSSSTAILAGISCYEIVSGEFLTVEEIFDHAMEFEPHPDNLAAGLFGGLTVSATSDDGHSKSLKTSVAKGIAPVLVVPEFELSTRRAREVLPDRYSRRDAVFNIQRSALLVAALVAGDWRLLSEAMRDRCHQPYRAPLIPGLDAVLAIEADGLAGIALSGAGPTVLAFAEPDKAERVGNRIVKVFERAGVSAAATVSRIDTEGRRFLDA